jgi:hypothetical protein
LAALDTPAHLLRSFRTGSISNRNLLLGGHPARPRPAAIDLSLQVRMRLIPAARSACAVSGPPFDVLAMASVLDRKMRRPSCR